MSRLSRDERRTALLLFARELESSAISPDALQDDAVQRAVRSMRVPSLPTRALQRLAMKRGKLTVAKDLVAPAVAARRAVLGSAAAGPPRILLRFDEYPNYAAADLPDERGTAQFEELRAILREAGVPWLVAVLPTVSTGSMDPRASGSRPLTDEEREMLAALRDDGLTTFGLHGLDHRTRSSNPRRHSELLGLSKEVLEQRLDAGLAVLDELGLEHRTFVAPFNRYTARQYDQLARRFDVVCGGPESVALLGFHGVGWRGNAVYLPSYAPFYGTAAGIADAVEVLAHEEAAVWMPATIHLADEFKDDLRGIRRLAAVLGASGPAVGGLAVPWDRLYDAVDRSAAA
jgi:peptidoglycan/xylan/chitin deacetylase (PgdA/CDA1 family)